MSRLFGMTTCIRRKELGKHVLCAFVFCIVLCTNLTLADTGATGSWRNASYSATLKNEAMEASFQAGLLYELKDRITGKKLISVDPADMPGKLQIFGTSGIDLDEWTVSQTNTGNSVEVIFSRADGAKWELHWSVEPGKGDLILRSSAKVSDPLEEFRILVPSCNIKDYTLVWIGVYGTGYTVNAPWEASIIGDPEKDGTPSGYAQPIVALFQGKDSGWFMEGREERVGPANIMAKGSGDTANIGFNRKFPLMSTSPEMYEIRIRPYHGSWEVAADPYVEWLDKGAEFLALDKLPKEQAWISKLKTQAYILVGNYAGLDQLAKRVNPQETFVGRQVEFRFYPPDVGYPDYRLPEPAKKWLKYARNMGFHVGMHFNCNLVSVMFPELVEKFKPGMQVTGKDPNGNDTYVYIYEGPNRMYRVSPALESWRDYLTAQLREAVEAGIDVVYLDETMTPSGKFVVDGMDGYQGMFELMRQILREYPHVAIETEQFNTLAAKYGKIALSQMPLGHPLAGYIFQKFVKVVPEGVMYSPTDAELMDAFDCWGFMLPGADTEREESWMQIAEAFHKYQLVPDGLLPRKQFTKCSNHYTGGLLPVSNTSIPAKGEKLFGFTGANGVTAYLERYPTKRGLVVYKPGKEPKWIGTRYSEIRSYPGPGVPVYYGFREVIKDWLIYDGQKILGLNPHKSYWFDTNLRPSPDRFHVFKVPEDFIGVWLDRHLPQEVGKDDMFFCLRMAGKGEIGVYVPEDYDAYLNGVKLEVDQKSRQSFAKINASSTGPTGLGYHIALKPEEDKQEPEKQGGPAYLIAFKRTDTDLKGNWPNLPWYGSPDSLKWITGNASNGFSMTVGAIGRFVGKIPKVKNVRIQGSYKMREVVLGGPGDGVIRINGT